VGIATLNFIFCARGSLGAISPSTRQYSPKELTRSAETKVALVTSAPVVGKPIAVAGM
jgi:hypothetical protein